MLCAVSSATAPRSAQHRYGLVLLLTTIAVVDIIIGPATPASRGSGVLLQGTMLLVVIATSRETRAVRRARVIVAAGVLVALALGIAFPIVPHTLGSSIAGLAIVSVLVVL